jgi:hypothetical protein
MAAADYAACNPDAKKPKQARQVIFTNREPERIHGCQGGSQGLRCGVLELDEDIVGG